MPSLITKSVVTVLCFIGLSACNNNGVNNEALNKNVEKKKPNILFIAIDDLRPELGSYGSDIAISPNLDRIAAAGLQFNKAYTQQPICGPSRASLMTGGRPDSIGVTRNKTYFRDLNPNIITLPQHFRENGYETAFAGKIYHDSDKRMVDAAHSWSKMKPAKMPKRTIELFDGFALKENQDVTRQARADLYKNYGESSISGVRSLAKGPAFESADVPDNAYDDGYNTDVAIEMMKEMAANPDKPFFLALGMKKPHLNWVAPKKYWDMYDPEDIKLSTQTEAPEGSSTLGLHPSFELRVRHGIPKMGPLGDDLSVKLKHAYLACISYVDAQIGRIVGELEKAGLRENTIIIVWSDHGWHLGEMGTWGKATNYEIATRVPLMIWTPDMPDINRGVQTEALVELVDIYPTLAELAGLTLPKHLDGQSFAPLLDNPEREWKQAAFSQFPTPALREWASVALKPAMRNTYFGDLIKVMEGRIKEDPKVEWNRELLEEYVMGYAMRTQRYRLIAWKDVRDLDKAPIDVELYDHNVDPTETKNIAAEHPKLVEQLLVQLKAGGQVI
ncbi:sulfatase [Pseudocolwellia sp. AS88]|uniref:sulfatase n=1 Tax=Pseudocolwellia sp. AS88 TaxID=3063958 RepID=UPI0026E9A928|nr:sulfatase [Pseudocolwellia sp. AS88]MDO7085171.1 sulfatase [Pseudocolwellia sp. AS88]